jgi:hypothetical protein
MSVIPIQGGVFEKLSENLPVPENDWHKMNIQGGVAYWYQHDFTI